MARINEHYLKLQGAYLFSEIAQRINQFKEEHPKAEMIRLGIGDVTRPLTTTVVKALHDAVDEMADASSFKGYGPEQGYDFLREKIAEDYSKRGVFITPDEIFVSDGSKCDTGNFQEILGLDNRIAVTDPVYPVYVDTNVMAGRSIVYLACKEENGFKPELPEAPVDVIYLCFPNNPTGMTLTKDELKVWVEYARSNDCLILYDAAYEAYIQEDNVAHSIYEIVGAKEVAVEFRSFSKTAGFTGTRCAYTVVPKALKAYDEKGDAHALNALWNRRQTTKFNGVPYIVQRAATAVYSEQGSIEIKALVRYYMENARIIREGLVELGFTVFGGVNAPYIWLKCPEGLSSWGFFDKLLKEVHIVGTPGVGFGTQGEGYFRLTAFGSRENTEKAIERMKTGLLR